MTEKEWEGRAGDELSPHTWVHADVPRVRPMLFFSLSRRSMSERRRSPPEQLRHGAW